MIYTGNAKLLPMYTGIRVGKQIEDRPGGPVAASADTICPGWATGSAAGLESLVYHDLDAAFGVNEWRWKVPVLDYRSESVSQTGLGT
jgi:hypothetical protein